MAIKEPILFITVEDFKSWKGFNKLEFDDVTTPDNEIWFAISIATNNIDYLSGFSISKKWPEETITDFTDNIQTATANYVRFLLTKDSNYIRGQSSISQGGLNFSETNPDDPYYIVPEVFNCLRKIKAYPNMTGFKLKGIEPQSNNWFNKFLSPCANDSPLNAYLLINSLKSLDIRTKITITHPPNFLNPIVNIDTRLIKDISALTVDDVIKYFDTPDNFKIFDTGTPGRKIIISEELFFRIMYLVEWKGWMTFKGLETDNKTIIGAINELNAKITKLLKGGD